MLKRIITILFLATLGNLFAQTMNIHTKNGNVDKYNLADIDSITFTILPSNIPTDGLVAYYPFNGNANDESGNGNDGTVYGATLTTDRFGNENSAYKFDGIDDFIWFGDKKEFKPEKITISSWFKTTSIKNGVNNSNFLIRYRSYGYTIFLNVDQKAGNFGGDLFVEGGFRYVFVSDSVQVNDGFWHFVAFTFNGNYYKFYLDGKKYFESNKYGTKKIYYINGGLAIGRDGDDSSDYFEGVIDDVRIYNRALTDQEILTLYYEK